jgi:hypothetical protein
LDFRLEYTPGLVLAEGGQPGRGEVQVSMMQAQKTEAQKTDLLVLPKEEEEEEEAQLC